MIVYTITLIITKTVLPKLQFFAFHEEPHLPVFTIKYNVQKWNTLCFEFSGRDTFSDLDKFMFIMHRLIIHTVLHTDLVCTVFTKRHLW